MAKELISQRIDKDVLKAIDKLAEDNNRTRSNQIETLLATAVKIKPKKEKK
jgi:hypothetical protein